MNSNWGQSPYGAYPGLFESLFPTPFESMHDPLVYGYNCYLERERGSTPDYGDIPSSAQDKGEQAMATAHKEVKWELLSTLSDDFDIDGGFSTPSYHSPTTAIHATVRPSDTFYSFKQAYVELGDAESEPVFDPIDHFHDEVLRTPEPNETTASTPTLQKTETFSPLAVSAPPPSEPDIDHPAQTDSQSATEDESDWEPAPAVRTSVSRKRKLDDESTEPPSKKPKKETSPETRVMAKPARKAKAPAKTKGANQKRGYDQMGLKAAPGQHVQDQGST